METESARIPALERAPTWRLRIAYSYSRRRFGKVLTTLKVLYARAPALLGPLQALLASEARLKRLEPSLRLLIKARVAAINGCSFCVDIAQCAADPDLRARLVLVAQDPASPLLSQAERAALQFVEEATRFRTVGDSTFEALRVCFSEAAIVEITWLNALENFLNLTTVPLKIGSDGLCALKARAPGAAHL